MYKPTIRHVLFLSSNLTLMDVWILHSYWYFFPSLLENIHNLSIFRVSFLDYHQKYLTWDPYVYFDQTSIQRSKTSSKQRLGLYTIIHRRDNITNSYTQPLQLSSLIDLLNQNSTNIFNLYYLSISLIFILIGEYYRW